MSEMHRILLRQLNKVGLSLSEPPKDFALWQKFLNRVSKSYRDEEQHRYMVDRASRLSGNEVQTLYEKINEERNVIRNLLSDGVFVTTENWRCKSANDKVFAILDMNRGGCLCQGDCELPPLDELLEFLDYDRKPITWEQIKETLLRQRLFTLDMGFVITPEKKCLPISVTINPIYYAGELTGYIAMLRDVSERLQITQALENAKGLAEEANHRKSMFLANMSHEIRTPMNGIIGMQQLLQMSELNDAQGQYVDASLFSANKLLKIINDILDQSKIEAGKLDVEAVSFHLRHELETAIRLWSSNCQSKNINFNFYIDDSVPDVVKGDPTRLNQVLTNLLGNAYKFTMPMGDIKFRVSATELADESYRLDFSIKDSGVGISDAEIEHIFDSFAQADVSTTREFGGSGLGLSISRQLIQLMGGDVYVSSEKNKGTLFTFYVFMKAGDLQSCAAEEDAENIKFQQDKFSGKVLVAEDNTINAMVVERLLKKLGVTVDVVVNGEQALDAVKKYDYHLILMDCNMPVLDGYQATEKIRRWESEKGVAADSTSHLPIMAVTANAFKEDEIKCREHGMDDHLAKPITVEALVEKLQRWLPARG
jgi:two-component system, sensor histidine kinase